MPSGLGYCINYVDTAFLKGYTHKELAAKTGEPERHVYFTLPPGSAATIRQFKGYEDYDEAKHCLKCLKPGTGTKEAPRAFSLKLAEVTRSFGLVGTSFDPEFEMADGLRTAKHVDDVNLTGFETRIDALLKRPLDKSRSINIVIHV